MAWEQVQLWTYCFIRRYFLVKFVGKPPRSEAADMELLVEQVYKKVQKHHAGTTRYASWVSVVCRNTFLNYLRDAPALVSIEAAEGAMLQDRTQEAAHEFPILFEAGLKAINRLPGYLREVAKLRLIEGYSYDEIARQISLPHSILRSYSHKAREKLSQDPVLVDFRRGS